MNIISVLHNIKLNQTRNNQNRSALYRYRCQQYVDAICVQSQDKTRDVKNFHKHCSKKFQARSQKFVWGGSFGRYVDLIHHITAAKEHLA